MAGSYTQEQLCAQPQQRAKSGFVVTTERAVYDIEKSIVAPASTLCYSRMAPRRTPADFVCNVEVAIRIFC